MRSFEVPITRKAARKITISDLGKYKALKGDFPTPTLVDDGSVMPEIAEITFGASTKTLTLRNWFAGMNKPLEILCRLTYNTVP